MKVGYALIGLSVVGVLIYAYNDRMAVAKAADGCSGCRKTVKKSAPPLLTLR